MDHNATPKEAAGAAKPLPIVALLVGLAVILFGSYSQYVIPNLNFVTGVLLVYGLPILVTGLIAGPMIIRKASNQMLKAAKYGFGYFGAFTALSIVVGLFIIILLYIFNPPAVELLQKPNPLLQIPPNIALLEIAVSFLIVGPAEEYLFRGFVFGGMLSTFKNRHWLIVAFISSIFFAIVHLYYAQVYEIASLVQFEDLVAFGMAMAATYYVTGGNLVVPALIHGGYDATAFIGVATSTFIGDFLRELLILIGVVFALVIFLDRQSKKSKVQS